MYIITDKSQRSNQVRKRKKKLQMHERKTTQIKSVSDENENQDYQKAGERTII